MSKTKETSVRLAASGASPLRTKSLRLFVNTRRARACGSSVRQFSLIRYPLPGVIVAVRGSGADGCRSLPMTAHEVPPCFINCDVAYLEARRTNSRETAGRATRASRKEALGDCAHASHRARRFARINSRATSAAMIECLVTGLLAWRDGQPGQVGNEAATAVFHQCRGSGSSPSSFLFVPLVLFPSGCFPCVPPVFLRSGESESAFPADAGLACLMALRRPAVPAREWLRLTSLAISLRALLT